MNNSLLLIVLVSLSFLMSCGTTTTNIIRSEVSLEKYDTDLRYQLKKPDGEGPFPAIVIMHGCNGLNKYENLGANQHADYFVKHGYVTLILDSFASRGMSNGSVCTNFDMQSSARYFRTYDAFAAYNYLDSLSYVNDNIYLIGQSNGGSVALQTAREGWQENVGTSERFSAVVGYYPWCGVITGWNLGINTPILVLAGELDDWTSAKECEDAKSAYNSEHDDGLLNVIVYPGAYHSFDLPITLQTFAGHRVGRNGPALVKSRKEILTFFDKHKSN